MLLSFAVKDAHKKRVRANLSYEDVCCLKSEMEVNHRELKEISKRTLLGKETNLQFHDLFPPAEVREIATRGVVTPTPQRVTPTPQG